MKSTWRRVSKTLIDTDDQRQGSVSVFFDYDLLSWTFGAQLELDECWTDFHLFFGPIQLSICYWRVVPVETANCS